MSRFWLVGARLLGPDGEEHDGSVAVEEGRIVDVREEARPDASLLRSSPVLDLEGAYLFPGLVDPHVHLRDFEEASRETVASGTRAAARGGYTTVCAMANSRPPLDSLEALAAFQARVAESAVVRVRPLAAVTRGLQGRELTEMGRLREAGAVAFSDDGAPLADAGLMRRALLYAGQLGAVLVAHEEEPSLSAGEPLAAGEAAFAMGFLGQPPSAETAMVARDLAILAETGGRLHLAHLSTAGAVAALRAAKAAGLPVTAEVTPHHLLLTEAACAGFRAEAKVNPPLRGPADQEALWAALADGTLDAVATDHAPHTAVDKARGFAQAPFGIAGLEAAFPLLYTYGVLAGRIGLAALLESMSAGPARLFGLEAPSLRPGAPADLFVYDPRPERTVEPEGWLSRGRNTPFAGWRVRGEVLLTLVEGRAAWAAPRLALPEAVGAGEAPVR